VHVPRHQRATADHSIVADTAIVRDVAGRHDVVVVADLGHRFRLRAARNRVVLANPVAHADTQIAALTFETFVQRIGPQHRPGRDLVILAHRSPALHVHIRLEAAARPDHYIGFDHTIFADARIRGD